MSTTSSLLTYLNAIAGRLPDGAITEWLEADASADVILQEDTCGNLVGEPMGLERWRRDDPSVVREYRVHSVHGAGITNLEWCKAEMARHNKKHPDSPIIVKRSHKSDKYVCLCKAGRAE